VTGQNPYLNKCVETAPLGVILRKGATGFAYGCLAGLASSTLESSSVPRARKLGYIIDVESAVQDVADIIDDPDAFSELEKLLNKIQHATVNGR
jgi:hypothetical protein